MCSTPAAWHTRTHECVTEKVHLKSGQLTYNSIRFNSLSFLYNTRSTRSTRSNIRFLLLYAHSIQCTTLYTLSIQCKTIKLIFHFLKRFWNFHPQSLTVLLFCTAPVMKIFYFYSYFYFYFYFRYSPLVSHSFTGNSSYSSLSARLRFFGVKLFHSHPERQFICTSHQTSMKRECIEHNASSAIQFSSHFDSLQLFIEL